MKLARLTATLLALATLDAAAQSNADGFIYGQTRPGALVTVERADRGFVLELEADADGRFRVPSLTPGVYAVNCEGVTHELRVRIGGGARVPCGAERVTELEAVEVFAAALPPVDTTQATTAFEISRAALESLPVRRNLSALARLAPGTISGDSGFGDLASFGGATVAENQYYLNGFNISDLRTRLAPATVPFEFFEEFQVMTGGYSAEFGRATGGVINAVSRRGGDDWQAGIGYTLEPAGAREQSPSVFVDGAPLYYHALDREDVRTLDLNLSGPILRERLHFFLLASLEERRTAELMEDEYTNSFQRGDFHDAARTRSPFSAGSFDWQIADGHRLNFTGFVDEAEERVTRSLFDRERLQPGIAQGDFTQHAGGATGVLRYSGELAQGLTLSALIGRGRVNNSLQTGAPDCPYVQDLRGDTPAIEGCWVADPALNRDERRAYRLDLQWNLGAHLFKFGADRESNHSRSQESLAGGAQYIVYDLAAGDPIGSTGAVAPSDGEYVEVFSYDSGGRFREELDGFYLEDHWQLLPTVSARFGLRWDRFRNRNTLGQDFISLRADPAPRLGLSWDVHGDSTAKLYANLGRYTSPVGTESAVRAGANYFATTEAFAFEGFSDDRTRRPILGESQGGTVFGDGSVLDPRSAVAAGLRPSYQDELIVGYQSLLPESWATDTKAGIAYTYRELKRTVEDVALDPGLNALLNDSGNANLQDCDGDGETDNFACGFDFYFITNPGEDVTVLLPTDAGSGRFDAAGEGELVSLTIPANLLGYPTPERRYQAVDLSIERRFGGAGFVQGAYTWSRSTGNYEGLVNSTIRQSNLALTQDFDLPGFTEGADGYLANDRRHKLKLFGGWQPLPDWQLGFAAYAESGRPYSALGYYRDLERPEAAYAQFSYYTTHPAFSPDGSPVLVPRGSAGRSDWQWNLDLSLDWTPLALDRQLSLGLDVFNVLDKAAATVINEISEDADGAPSTAYRQPREFQAPRSLRLRLRYEL